jgi:glycosyltransferase involved in cell wall biosynthesis
MRIAILGTRGIPNHYGGFEQCAEYLAVGLVERGFDVLVYNSHNHPYKQSQWNGVEIVHCFDPENSIGTAGQFVYDLNCILDIRKRNIDIILQLGYTSSSVWGRLLPKNVVVTTNMDGLEWKRTKYTNRIKKFLLYAERLGTKYSDYLISDSIGIQDYISEKYHKKSVFIPYGAHLFDDADVTTLFEYNVTEYNYDMLIARLEPENSIEIILDGVMMAKGTKPFLVIGKHLTKYGEYLKEKYKSVSNILFIGGVYDINKLNNLRHYSNIYFHGHTVGGTNPSLLEAMASNSLICANDNPFNRYILNEDAIYFKTAQDVAKHLAQVDHTDISCQNMINANRDKITNIYAWDIIIDQYANHFKEIEGKLMRK